MKCNNLIAKNLFSAYTFVRVNILLIESKYISYANLRMLDLGILSRLRRNLEGDVILYLLVSYNFLGCKTTN